MSVKVSDRGVRVVRINWVELSCILCGEWAATLENGSLVVRPRANGDAKRVNGCLVCGRCGGNLSPTDQGQRIDLA